MKLTLPTVALVVIQISYIYCFAVRRDGQLRSMGRSLDVRRGTKWNAYKQDHQKKLYSSSNDLLFKSQGRRAGQSRNMGRSRDVRRGAKWNAYKQDHQKKLYSSSNDLLFKSQGLKAKNILLSFSMDSSHPNKVESSLTPGRRGSKTSGGPKRVKKSKQKRGRKLNWNSITAPYKALKKKISLKRRQSQRLRGKRGFKTRT